MMNLKSCIPNNSIFQTLLKVFILTKIMHLLSCLNLTIFFQDSASEGEGVGDEIPDIEEKEDGGSANEFEEDDFIVDAEG